MPVKADAYNPDRVYGEWTSRKLKRFVLQFWDIVSAEELIWEPHMDVLCDEITEVYERVFLRPDETDPQRMIRLEKDHDLIINIPPGTTKSTIVTILAPAWGWTRDATLRFITASYSDSLATEHSQKSRDVITSDKYKSMYPEVRIKDDKGLKTNYETTANGQRFATSVGGTVTGVHAHIIIIDDPLSPEGAASQSEINRANRWMSKTIPMRKIDKKVTATILIMQRLAVNDPTGALLDRQKKNIRHVCLPGELSKNVKPEKYEAIYQNGLLSPLRLGRKELDEAKVDLGSAGYAGQISQLPAPEGGTVWQKWFIEVPDDMFPEFDKCHEPGTDWDLAYTKEDKNAASAFVKSGTMAGNIYIFDFNWQWLEFPELIKWMKRVEGPHFIEAKASGKSARQVLKRNGIVAIEIKVHADKIARAKDATPVAEAGLVYIKRSMADRLYNDSKQGILFFPNGQYADLADCLSQMLVRRTKRGKIVSSNSGQRLAQEDQDAEQVPATNPLDWV